MKIHMITLECLHTLLEMVQVAEYQSVPKFNQMSEGNAVYCDLYVYNIDSVKE